MGEAAQGDVPVGGGQGPALALKVQARDLALRCHLACLWRGRMGDTVEVSAISYSGGESGIRRPATLQSGECINDSHNLRHEERRDGHLQGNLDVGVGILVVAIEVLGLQPNNMGNLIGFDVLTPADGKLCRHSA